MSEHILEGILKYQSYSFTYDTPFCDSVQMVYSQKQKQQTAATSDNLTRLLLPLDVAVVAAAWGCCCLVLLLLLLLPCLQAATFWPLSLPQLLPLPLPLLTSSGGGFHFIFKLTLVALSVLIFNCRRSRTVVIAPVRIALK